MLQFLQHKVEKRYVNFKGDDPVAVFLDRADALFYSQYYPLYGLEEVHCIIVPPCGYEDEGEHNLAMVRVLLKKTPTDDDQRTQVELWCSDGLEEAFLYAYAYHLSKGGNKENFDARLTYTEFFNFDDDYDVHAKTIHSNPFLTEILSHANENNYPLVLSLLEVCICRGITDKEGLLQAEQDSFTYPDRRVTKEDEQIAIVEPQAHYHLAYELFTDYGFQADAYYRELYQAAKTNTERKKALIFLFVIRGYTLCFPTLAYDLIVREEVIPTPKKS